MAPQIEQGRYNLQDGEYQFWQEFEVNGQLVQFDHLRAARVTYERPNRNERYTLYFTFSHHTFTSSNSVGFPRYPHSRGDIRVFDPRRYELSFHLPKIIALLPEQFFYHGGYARFCTCKLKDSDGSEINYQVVYRTWRKAGKLRFHVESAYPLDAAPRKVKKVNFWSICYNLAKGKSQPKPAR